MENIAAMNSLVERRLIPPAVAALIEAIGLEDVSPEGMEMVRQIIGLTEGQALLNRLVAKMLATTIIAYDELQAIERDREAQRQAEEGPTEDTIDEDALPPAITPTLEEIQARQVERFDAFIAERGLTREMFDQLPDERRAGLADQFELIQSQQQPEGEEQPQADLTRLKPAGEVDPAQLVGLSEEDKLKLKERVEQEIAAAAALATTDKPQLDHDGDGGAGGSKKGDESTAHKGAVKRRSGKGKRKSRSKAKPKG